MLDDDTNRGSEAPQPPSPFTDRLRAETVRQVERSSGELAAASIQEMSRRWPWFSKLPADQRANVGLVTQIGVANFCQWLHQPTRSIPLTAEAFRSAPRDMARWVSLRQTVELVRAAIDTFEARLPEFAANSQERAALREGILYYGREIAFSAATVYAGAAEARGAWDARLEALVVDGIFGGDEEEATVSRAHALGWDPQASVSVMLGNPPGDDPRAVISQVRAAAARSKRSVLVGLHGSRLVVVLAGSSGAAEDEPVLSEITACFGPGPVVAGPQVSGLGHAPRSAGEAVSAQRAVAAWPGAPRPVTAAQLLPERAMAGDPEAERRLVGDVARPLAAAGASLVETVDAYAACGGVLESCARALFVHPNTVRYRLRRVTELTGSNPTGHRGALTLQVALALARLAGAEGFTPPEPETGASPETGDSDNDPTHIRAV